MKDLVVLSSDSHTLDGCDRVMLAGDQVIVQGKPAAPGRLPVRSAYRMTRCSTRSRSGCSWRPRGSSSGS